jgi:hypothetical protein
MELLFRSQAIKKTFSDVVHFFIPDKTDGDCNDVSLQCGGITPISRLHKFQFILLQHPHQGIESLNGDSQCFVKSGFRPHKHCQFFASKIFVKRQHCEEKRTKLVSNCLQKLTALMAFHLSSCRRAVKNRLLAELSKTIKRNIFCSISDKRVGGFRN